MRGQCVCRLDEDQRIFRGFRRAFLAVVYVIRSDGDYIRRIHGRKKVLYRIQRDGFACFLECVFENAASQYPADERLDEISRQMHALLTRKTLRAIGMLIQGGRLETGPLTREVKTAAVFKKQSVPDF